MPDGVSADWARIARRCGMRPSFPKSGRMPALRGNLRLPCRMSFRRNSGEAARDFARAGEPLWRGDRFRDPFAARRQRRSQSSCACDDDDAAGDGRRSRRETYLERENKWLLANDLPATDMQLRDLRQRWRALRTSILRAPGLIFGSIIVRIWSVALRSSRPSIWVSMPRKMERRGLDVSRTRLDEDAAKRNAELIRESRSRF